MVTKGKNIMKQFAVIDMKTRVILSLHTTRELAEARLRAELIGVINRGLGVDAIPNFITVRTDGTAQKGCRYSGRLWVRAGQRRLYASKRSA